MLVGAAKVLPALGILLPGAALGLALQPTQLAVAIAVPAAVGLALITAAAVTSAVRTEAGFPAAPQRAEAGRVERERGEYSPLLTRAEATANVVSVPAPFAVPQSLPELWTRVAA